MSSALIVVVSCLGIVVYAYAGYPVLVRLLRRGVWRPPAPPTEWPPISISLPAYNEAATIATTIERLLATDYPANRRELIVVSDASTDGTDDIVRRYADRGVRLVRQPTRQGKTAAENAVAAHLAHDIVINTDASVVVDAHAIKPLVQALLDPSVGVASCHDVSVGRAEADVGLGEAGYIGYDMWLRGLETDAGGIVGASGCLYAIRTALHRQPLPDGLSRDFASALIAREHGYRAVSVPEARCYVPRSSSLHSEFRRKRRTVARGMQTLWHKRHLLAPWRTGRFAWMLASRKVGRWSLPLALLVSVIAAATAVPTAWWARLYVGGAVAITGLAMLAWWWPTDRTVPRWLSAPGYFFFGNLAVLLAWWQALRGTGNATWEPTRRGPVISAP